MQDWLSPYPDPIVTQFSRLHEIWCFGAWGYIGFALLFIATILWHLWVLRGARFGTLTYVLRLDNTISRRRKLRWIYGFTSTLVVVGVVFNTIFYGGSLFYNYQKLVRMSVRDLCSSD